MQSFQAPGIAAATTLNTPLHSLIRQALVDAHSDKFNAGKALDPFLVEAQVAAVADAIEQSLDNGPPSPMELAFEAIETERTYQDAEFGNAARTFTDGIGKKGMTPGEIITTIDVLNGFAKTQWYKPNNTAKVADTMRKIAGCAVQFLERYGAPKRQFTAEQKNLLAARDTAETIIDAIFGRGGFRGASGRATADTEQASNR